MSSINPVATDKFADLKSLFLISIVSYFIMLVLTLIGIISSIKGIYPFVPFAVIFSLCFVMEIITII